MRAVRRFERELDRFAHAMRTSLRGAPIDEAAGLRAKVVRCLKLLRSYDEYGWEEFPSQSEYEDSVIAEGTPSGAASVACPLPVDEFMAWWGAKRKEAETSTGEDEAGNSNEDSADEVVKHLVGPAQKVRGTRDSKMEKRDKRGED